jgi:hypothetical protein
MKIAGMPTATTHRQVAGRMEGQALGAHRELLFERPDLALSRSVKLGNPLLEQLFV